MEMVSRFYRITFRTILDDTDLVYFSCVFRCVSIVRFSQYCKSVVLFLMCTGTQYTICSSK